jgi:hypothetical protein
VTIILSQNCCDCDDVYNDSLEPCDECPDECPSPCPVVSYATLTLTFTQWLTNNADEEPWAGNCTTDFTDPDTGTTLTFIKNFTITANLVQDGNDPSGETYITPNLAPPWFNTNPGEEKWYSSCAEPFGSSVYEAEIQLIWDGSAYAGPCGLWEVWRFPFTQIASLLEPMHTCSPVGTNNVFYLGVPGQGSGHSTYNELEITAP